MEGPKLELNPEAAKAFNAEATELAQYLQTPTIPPRPGPAAFVPQVFVTARLTEKDFIGDFQTSQVSPTLPRIEVSRDCVRNDEHLGLGAEAYARFSKMIDKLRATRCFRNSLSTECLRELSFDWLLKRRQDAIETPFVDHLISEASNRVKETTIWLPVQRLYIQSEIRLGRVVFRTITPQMLDAYASQPLGTEEGSKQWAEHVLKLRNKFQGAAAATVKTLAEPIRAYEVASEEARTAVGLLRFFQPASGIPNVKSYCALSSEQNLATVEYLIDHSGNMSYAAKALLEGPPDCFLSDQDINLLKYSGLDKADLILSKSARTDLESVLLDCLLLYSRANLSADPADKLVYIFAALETMFLKDENEPIQSSLGDRLAWLVGATVEERMQIRKLVKEVYALRSRFVHHGHAPRDLEKMAPFMRYSWTAFCGLIHEVDSFPTKSALIDDLDLRKMGG